MLYKSYLITFASYFFAVAINSNSHGTVAAKTTGDVLHGTFDPQNSVNPFVQYQGLLHLVAGQIDLEFMVHA